MDTRGDGVRLGLLFAGADSTPLQQRPALVRTIKALAGELEQAHGFNPDEWQPGSVAIREALAELAKAELGKLYTEIEASQQSGLGLLPACT